MTLVEGPELADVPEARDLGRGKMRIESILNSQHQPRERMPAQSATS
jgi:hypothetical protein